MADSAALGGVLTALSLIFLYLASYAPSMKITMFFISGLLIAVSLIEKGIRTAWLVYVTSSILSLLVLSNIAIILPYICFFGLYPLVKYYIEKNNRNKLETIMKLLFCNLSLSVVYLIWIKLLGQKIIFPISMIYILILIQPVFLFYDYIFTRVVFYYTDKVAAFRRKD